MAVGVIFTEIDLDMSKFVAKQKKLLSDIEKVGVTAEKGLQQSFTNLGVSTDNIYQLMANKAIKSYERIAQAGKASAEEQFRAQSSMVAKINSINAEMTRNPLFETLGIRSTAAIEAQKKAVMNSYDTIKQSAGLSSQDLVNIERAKNNKLKELNKEMVGEHDMSMASMTRAVLRFYAAWYVVSAAAVGFKDLFMGGIEAIDSLKVSTIAVASQITSMQGTTGNVLENYKQNVVYAEALNKKLMEIDANSFANLNQIQLMNRAMSLQGVILDVNKQKQIEAFTALTNAVSLFTQGQDKEKQASQEIRALMTGQVKAGDMVAQMMDGLIKRQGVYKGGLAELVKEGNKHGDTLERMLPYLSGITAAASDVQKTWAAVSSSAETAWGIIQRAVFKDIYKELISSGTKATQWMKDNAEEMAKVISTAYTAIKFSITAAILVTGALALSTVTAGATIGKAIAWISSQWALYGVHVMTAETITLSAMSKMTLGFGVFVAGIVGFSIGSYLSSQFEWARTAGVAMVYGLIRAWDVLVYSAKVTKIALNLFLSPEEQVKQISALKKQYEEKKAIDEKYRDEQFKDVTDAAIAEAKAKAEAAAKIKAPSVTGGKDGDPLKQSFKDRTEMLRDAARESKAFYDEQIKDAEHAAKMSRQYNFDELSVIKTLYDAKENALNDYLGVQYKEAAVAVKNEAAKAAEAKKTFDAQSVLQKKYDAIYAAYRKDWAQLENKRAEETIATFNKRIDAEAKMWGEIDKYSSQAVSAEIGKWIKDAAEFIALTQDKATAAEWFKEKLRQLNESQAQQQADFYGQVMGYEQTALAYQLDVIDQKAAKFRAQKMDELAITKWVEDEKAKLTRNATDKAIDEFSKKYDDEHKYQKQTITNSIAVADNAMALMDKESQGYAAMVTAKKVLQVAEIAMQVEKNLMIAVGAVLNEATGDPYTAFARMAAMAAAVAGILSIVGIAFGGVSGSDSSASKQPAMGNSTVLGAAYGTGSESIANSYKLLEDTYDMENTKLTGIWNSMKDLNNNITGLVTSIVRNISAGGAGIPFVENDPQTMLKFTETALGRLLSGDFLTPFAPGLINNLFEGIFGGGAFAVGKQELVGSSTGITTGGANLGNLVGGAGIQARNYQEWTTRTTTDFWREDSYDYNYAEQAVSAETQRFFDLVYQGMSNTIREIGIALGAESAKVMAYAFPAMKLNLQGMTGEQINKTLQEYFSAIGDTAVQVLFGGILSQYQKLNEGLMETATRIIQDKAIVEGILSVTGQAFVGTTAQAIAFSESLITLAGSLENLADFASNYVDKFYSDAEKQARLYNNLTAVMAQHSLALPGTRDAYRDIVESLDLTTEAGKRAYVSLLSLADSADTYYTYIEELVDKRAEIELRLLGLTATAAELLAIKRQKELAAMDASLRPLQSLIYLYEDLATAISTTSSAIDNQISAANTMASAARSAASAYKNITESLQSAIDKIRGVTASNSGSKFFSTYATAMTGDQAALSALPGLADNLLTASMASASTAEEYAITQGKTLIALAEAKNVSIGMTNWEEYQATLLEAQVATLTAIKEELSQPGPDTVLLTQQAGILTDIATLLQQQTTQIVSGNNLTTTMLQDQTGKITAGNTLTSNQTAQVITGNATSDAIKNLQNLNTSYSEAMLTQLVSSSSTQSGNLESILTANNKTVSLLDQLVSLTTNSMQEKAIASIDAAANNLAAINKALTEAVSSQTMATSVLLSAQAAASAPELTLAQVLSMNAGSGYSAADAPAQAGVISLGLGKLPLNTLLTNLYNQGLGSVITQKESSYMATNYNDLWESYGHYYLDANGGLVSADGGSYHADLGQGWATGGPTGSAGITASVQAQKAAQEASEQSALTAAFSAAQAATAQVVKANEQFAAAQSTYNALVAKYESTFGTLPSHATGLERVPYDDYLMRAHKDESILAAPEATEWRNYKTGKSLHTSSNVAVVEELRALRQELKDLKAGNYEIAKNTLKTARVLSNITDGAVTLSDGMPAMRTVA